MSLKQNGKPQQTDKKPRPRKDATPKALEKPRSQALSREMPGVVVRVKGHAKAVTLVNIPQTETGTDLVLYMIGAHPDTAARTADGPYVNFGDIVTIVKPSCEDALVEEAKKMAPESPNSNDWIAVRHPTRIERDGNGRIADVLIRICNIPNSVGGRELLQEIFEVYGGRGAQEYTLCTLEQDDVPIRLLAEANGHKH